MKNIEHILKGKNLRRYFVNNVLNPAVILDLKKVRL